MNSNLPNLFELLELDVSRDWTYETFEREIKEQKAYHSRQQLNAPKPDLKRRSKEISQVLKSVEVNQQIFKSHLNAARHNDTVNQEKQLEQKQRDLIDNLKLKTIDGYLLQSEYQDLHKQFVDLQIGEEFERLTQDLEKVPEDRQTQKVGLKDRYSQTLYYLKAVGKRDLYDLLGLSPDTPTEELVQAAQRLYDRYARSSEANQPYQHLSVHAQKIFREDKHLYDEYLLCSRIEPAWGWLDDQLVDEIVTSSKAAGILSTVKNRLNKSELSDDELVISVKLYALRQHGIWVVKPRKQAPTPATGAAAAPAPIPPPTGASSLKPADDRVRIKDEAERLWKQRKYQQALDKIDEAIAFKPRAQDTLSRACRKLRDRIQSDQAELENTRKVVREAYNDKRLTAARSQMTDWEKLAPVGDAEVSDFRRMIDEAFHQWRTLLDAADKAREKQAFSVSLENLTEALGICVDDREQIEQQRVAIITHLRDQAQLLAMWDSSGAIRRLTELSALLVQNAISDEFGITDAIERIDSAWSSRDVLLRRVESHVSKNEIRAARKLISEYPDLSKHLPVLQQISERESQIDSVERIAAKYFQDGKYSEAFRDYQRLTQDLCSDDPEYNAFYASFSDHVMAELRGLDRGRVWDVVEVRAKQAVDNAELLGLNKYREEILSLIQHANNSSQEMKKSKDLTQMALRENRHFAARKRLQQWEMLSTGTDRELQRAKQVIERAIEQANRLCENAVQMDNPFGAQAQVLYQQALAICADHPDALQRAGKMTPPAPLNFRVSELEPGKLEFCWDPSRSADAADVTYMIYGRDGKIGETRDTRLHHSNVENGRLQRYHVIAVWNNISSDMSNEITHIALGDVANLSAEQTANMLILTWNVPDNVSRVLIMRSRDRTTLRNLPGDQTCCEIPVKEIDDNQLIIVCRYDISNYKQLESDGIRVEVTGLRQPAESGLTGIRDLSVWLTRNQIVCRWTWQTALRQATIEVDTLSPGNPKILASREVSAFERDTTSEYQIALDSQIQPGDTISVKVQVPDLGCVTINKKIANTHFTYHFDVKKRLFGAPQYELVVEAHNLADPVTLYVDLHQSSHPIKVPLADTFMKTLTLPFSRAGQTIRQKIEKRDPRFSFAQIFSAPMNSTDTVYLIDQFAPKNEQPQLP